MKIKIDKEIKMPDANGKGRTPRYPFRELEIGESFLYPSEYSRSAYSNASNASKRMGKLFECRKTEKGIRVWRTK